MDNHVKDGTVQLLGGDTTSPTASVHGRPWFVDDGDDVPPDDMTETLGSTIARGVVRRLEGTMFQRLLDRIFGLLIRLIPSEKLFAELYRRNPAVLMDSKTGCTVEISEPITDESLRNAQEAMEKLVKNRPQWPGLMEYRHVDFSPVMESTIQPIFASSEKINLSPFRGKMVVVDESPLTEKEQELYAKDISAYCENAVKIPGPITATSPEQERLQGWADLAKTREFPERGGCGDGDNPLCNQEDSDTPIDTKPSCGGGCQWQSGSEFLPQ